MPAVTVYLGLGSNLGDREGHLGRGLDALGARGVRVTAVSALYETEPVGGPAQGPYLNLAAAAQTALSPAALLQAALETDPKNGAALLNLALVQYETGRVDSARRTLELVRAQFAGSPLEARAQTLISGLLNG